MTNFVNYSNSKMRKYNIINNSLGWFCFLVAAVTYLLTIEPTASFWDCPEFILQGAKLEIGHPPGNPIFMLAARFFITLFGNNMATAAVAVNCMSALLSAATILLLFWTITHLIRRLIVRDDATEISWPRLALIMGGGLCGALAYTWSDTFWYSAVEGEVYAFSSFCTALVFWLILKWENRADRPNSDRYLLLIAYVIGISIAVHLLNLLCIPAIGLVFYYRKYKKVNAVGSLIALGVSCVVVALILYGLVPGVMKMSQFVERMFVNGFGASYNLGVLVYAIALVAVLVWSMVSFDRQRSTRAMKWSFFLGVLLSGIFLIGHGAVLPCLLTAALGVWLMFFCHKVPVRILNLIVTSILVIFIGYSSYALLLIRSNANTPMNQNAPDNVFTLASYLNREQYGESPLFYGPTVIDELYTERYQDDSGAVHELMYFDDKGYILTKEEMDGNGVYPLLYGDDGYPVNNSEPRYVKKTKLSSDESDEYVEVPGDPHYVYFPASKVLFPRMHNAGSNRGYRSWSEMPSKKVPQEVFRQFAVDELSMDDGHGGKIYAAPLDMVRPVLEHEGITEMVDRSATPGIYPYFDMIKSDYQYNLRYFLNYQLNHMYWRYFMWNFAGRQNDIPGNGEPQYGNWISGIPFIDNARLGDQSLLPAEYGSGNKGHNVFYMLPLVLGIIGLLWQSLYRHRADAERGIQQFWVVFFLFFMTGIAIVLYLNQTPGQPRERDYAFAGSFYAFAIWIGMAVPALGVILGDFMRKLKKQKSDTEESGDSLHWAWVLPAVLIGLLVPLQMVSQTWDDHDRSGRYTARDFGMNYLSSVDDNAVIFTYGDNDTFPLWYAQEVEGYRTDVKVVNLSYYTSEWYVNSLRMPHHGSMPIDIMAQPRNLAYRSLMIRPAEQKEAKTERVDAVTAFTDYYSQDPETAVWRYPNFYIASDSAGAVKAFDMAPGSVNYELGFRPVDLQHNFNTGASRYQNGALMMDLVATNAAKGWPRPLYFAVTVPEGERSGFSRYVYSTGMADQITPFDQAAVSPTVEKAYANIVEKYRWGGLDAPDADRLYLDETVRRMVISTRETLLQTALDLSLTGSLPASAQAREYARKHGLTVPETRNDMARYMLQLLEEKLPVKAQLRAGAHAVREIQIYLDLYAATGNKADLQAARSIIDQELPRYKRINQYAESLGSDRYRKAGRDLEYDVQVYHSLQRQADQIKEYEEGKKPEITPDYAQQLKQMALEEGSVKDSIL